MLFLTLDSWIIWPNIRKEINNLSPIFNVNIEKVEFLKYSSCTHSFQHWHHSSINFVISIIYPVILNGKFRNISWLWKSKATNSENSFRRFRRSFTAARNIIWFSMNWIKRNVILKFKSKKSNISHLLSFVHNTPRLVSTVRRWKSLEHDRRLLRWETKIQPAVVVIVRVFLLRGKRESTRRLYLTWRSSTGGR